MASRIDIILGLTLFIGGAAIGGIIVAAAWAIRISQHRRGLSGRCFYCGHERTLP